MGDVWDLPKEEESKVVLYCFIFTDRKAQISAWEPCPSVSGKWNNIDLHTFTVKSFQLKHDLFKETGKIKNKKQWWEIEQITEDTISAWSF